MVLLSGMFLILSSCSNPASNPEVYNLDILISPDATGTVSIDPHDIAFNEGDIVTLIATPGIGWEFDRWSGDISITSRSATITMVKDFAVVANFVRQAFPIKIQTEGGGIVNKEVIREKSYNIGTWLELTAVADEGWEFSEWKGSISGSENPREVFISDTTNVTAVFIHKLVDIEVSTEGDGTVTQEVVPGKKYDYGTRVQLTAIPDEGWGFQEWKGDITGKKNPVTVRLTETKSVKAVFIRHYPLVETAEATTVTYNRATAGGVVVSTGIDFVARRGVVWSRSPNPTLDSAKGYTDDGGGIGSFSSSITGLNQLTQYYFRSYAINSAGITYGEERAFTTRAVILPTVFTNNVDQILFTTAEIRANVSSEGDMEVTSRGVVWGTTMNPTIDSNDGMTVEGAGPGTFISELSGLNEATAYHARAYATSSAGTTYGSDLSFETLGRVTNPSTGRVWIDRNQGARRKALFINDHIAYGYWYQWGRRTDGHQQRNSLSSYDVSTFDQPHHGRFIFNPNFPHSWRNPINDNLWQGVDGVNNPCPPGYRVPTIAEWTEEMQTWIRADAAGAFNSPLKLTVGSARGYRPEIRPNPNIGRYWSSTVSGNQAMRLAFDYNGAFEGSEYRAAGKSVRCIMD